MNFENKFLKFEEAAPFAAYTIILHIFPGVCLAVLRLCA